jgi:hypothetical protein
MIPRDTKPRIPPLARQDTASRERRHSPPYRLHDIRGSLSWQAAEGEVASDLTVMNISGGGATVLAERAPVAGQAVRLHLKCGSARIEPIDALALEVSPDDSGKTVVHLRFARWVPLDAILKGHQEGRLWQRYPARESRATLMWLDGSTERTMPGELLNLSGGGAAVVAEVQPPPGVSIWLQLEAGIPQGHRIDPVECHLVSTSTDPSGRKIAHLEFIGPCTMELFGLVVNGAEWALGGRIPAGPRLIAGERRGSARI